MQRFSFSMYRTKKIRTCLFDPSKCIVYIYNIYKWHYPHNYSKYGCVRETLNTTKDFVRIEATQTGHWGSALFSSESIFTSYFPCISDFVINYSVTCHWCFTIIKMLGMLSSDSSTYLDFTHMSDLEKLFYLIMIYTLIILIIINVQLMHKCVLIFHENESCFHLYLWCVICLNYAMVIIIMYQQSMS